MCTTPPLAASARSISSVMLRGAALSARLEEWEAMIGALDRQFAMVTLTIGVCVAVALVVVCPARAASARDPKFQHNLEATVRYLQNSQREDGGFAEPGSKPGSDFTAWVALALAAAGINPRDQTTAKQHWVGEHSAYTFLAERAHEASLTTDFERELLVVEFRQRQWIDADEGIHRAIRANQAQITAGRRRLDDHPT